MRTLDLKPARWAALAQQCRRVTGNRADAEDAVQDAALAVLRRLPALDAASTDVDAYLAVAARNAALRTITRRRAVAPLHEQREAADPHADVVAQVQRRALNAELRTALAAIPPRQREALLLFDVAGCDGREVGERLGLAPNAVNQLVFRARGSMRERLDAGSRVDPGVGCRRAAGVALAGCSA